MRTLACLALLAALPAVAAPKGPPCDPKQIAELKKTIPKAEIATWTNTVSQALATACADKLPKSVADTLNDFRHSEQHDHAAAIILAFRDAAPFANAGCKDWQTKVDAVGNMAPGDKLRKLYKDCDLAKTKVLTEDEFVMVADLGAAYTIAPMYTWLTKGGMDAGTAKNVVRWLAAVPEAKKPEKPEKADPKKKKK